MESTFKDYLDRRGIRLSEDAFVEVVRQAIERVLGSVQAMGQRGLPPDEQKRLEEGGFTFGAPELGPDHPVLRGAAEFAALLGSAWTVAEAARFLGVNDTRVRQRLTGPKRTLYGIKRDREWWLPRFQFAEHGLIAGIGDVIAALSTDMHPVSVWRWFTTPNPDLRSEDSEQLISPLDWLRAGYDPEEAVSLAEML
ncbi:MAG: hypothetical protein V3V67_13830 [Myxococcota bacterium]